MIRDPGPSHNLGFGLNAGRVMPGAGSNERTGADPDGSFISKALHDHPYAKFLAASAATMIGMHYAGKLIKSGGNKLMIKGLDSELPMIKNAFSTMQGEMRNIGRTLDAWEGVVQGPNGAKIPMPGSYRTAEETAAIARGEDPIAEWGFREKIQSKLVSQARRLPYELPAAYLVQRAPGIGTDDMFGYGQEGEKPNWYNPVDVLGDFAQQSVKNLAGFLLPVEAGPTVMKEGWRRILQHADGVASPVLKDMTVNLDQSLRLLGHSSADILAKMVHVSGKSAASFGAGINEAVLNNRGTVDMLHEWRHSIRTQGAQQWVKNQWNAPALDTQIFDLVHPISAGRQFARGFRKSWSHQIGGEINRDSFDFLAQNAEAANLGLPSFKFKHGKSVTEVGVDKRLAGLTRTGNSEIEQTAHYLLSQMSHGSGGGTLFPSIDEMRGTPLYDELLNMHYKREVADSISRTSGMNYEDVKQVIDQLTIKRRPTGDPMPMAERFTFGTVEQVADNNLYRQAMGDTLERKVPGHGKAVIDALFKRNSALAQADSNFQSNMSLLEGQLFTQWRTTMRDVVIPGARQRLGKSPVAYEALYNMRSEETRNFLIRNTADRINAASIAQGKGEAIPLMTERNGRKIIRRTDDIASDLKGWGFDVDHPESFRDMRSFLSKNKVVSDARHEGGYNRFGFRRFSVEDALQRGYFDDEVAPMIRELHDNIVATDPLGGGKFTRTPLGGMWESRSGKVLDFSPFRNSYRKVMDSFSENFQVPLLHIGAPTFGSDVQSQMAQTPILQIIPGDSYQPFTGVSDPTDLWVFQRGRRSKGKLSRIFGNTSSETLDGQYRAMPTDPHSMLGRHVRMAIGDKGQISDEKRTGWKRLFSVDENQPDSMRQRYKRMKGGRTWGEILKGERSRDPSNPAVMARMLRDSTPEGKAALADFMRRDPAGAARAFKIMENQLRINNINDHVLRQLLEMQDIDEGLLGRVLKPGGRNITDITTAADMREVAKAKIEERFGFVDPNAENQKNVRNRLKWAYETFIGKHEDQARAQGRYYESKASSQKLRRRGVFRRIDEARAELLRLGLVEEGLKNENGFGAASGELFERLDILKREGKITAKEYTESRAAIFSTQLAYENIANFQAGVVRQERILNAIRSASNISDVRLNAVLDDIANNNIEVGQFAGAKKVLKRRLGSAEYEFPGEEYNPFGGNFSDTVFVPTASTAIKRSGIRAVGSILGFGTWNNPEAFSGSAIPLAHGVQRLNGFLGSVGMSLDETDFRGPMDFYARGIVGKRVLPAVAAGATFMALDRTAGGMVHERDQNGDRNYSPLVLGGVATGIKEAQVGMAGLLPGGQTMAEKREELENGEVAIRKGRWWPLGNTPWKGGRIEYYRPSWYRRFKAGATYTDETYGTPLEKLMYGYDFSPLRPFDPYHYEKKNYDTRPYPVTGDYFTGPWGPLTGVLNSTIGRALKPAKMMHEDEVNYKLSHYQQVGANGIAAPSEQIYYSDPTIGGAGWTQGGGVGISGGGVGSSVGGGGSGSGGTVSGGFRPGAGGAGPITSTGYGSGSGIGISTVGLVNREIQNSAYQGNNSLYGITNTQGGFTPRVINAGEPINPMSMRFQASDVGYKAQELLGIYGFTFGAVRTSLGLGSQDMSPKRPVLASANKAYGSTRSFWDLGLGGLGDVPTPFEGDMANIEFSEFVRRFLNRERSDVNYLNPISNQAGRMYPWLPGADYFQNFKEGDPYAAIKTGEERLPGKGYEKLNDLHPDYSGRYGAIDQFKILGDIAPYSKEYRQLDRTIDKSITTREEQSIVDTVRKQVMEKAKKHDFTPYEYKGVELETDRVKLTQQIAPGVFYTNKRDMAPVSIAGVTPGRNQDTQQILNDLVGKEVSITYDKARPVLKDQNDRPLRGETMPVMIRDEGDNVNKLLLKAGGTESDEGEGLLNADATTHFKQLHAAWETVAHRDTPINTKFLPERTAMEEWERQNVYGATFPQWQHPIKDFLMPAVYKSTNRGPILSAIALGGIGGLFGVGGRGSRGGIIGSLIGTAVGFGAGLMRNAEEHQTGERFMPKFRKQELAAEEYSDILSYVKYRKLAAEAPDQESAANYMEQAKRTMYGADLHGDINDMIAAVPDRKRAYFKEMLHAPKKDRKRVLSTAGRLERRLYESAWGMGVEQRPDLEDYFSEHELPGPDWEGWAPDADMENVKIKVAQSMGLDVAQMGYYPQQIQAANAINMSYPDIQQPGQRRATHHLLQSYLSRQGITGSVRGIPNGTPHNQLVMTAGVR